MIEMRKGSNRLNVLDFIISVLTRHEREIDKNLTRLERVTRKLEKLDKNRAPQKVSPSRKRPRSEHRKRQKTEKKAACQQSL